MADWIHLQWIQLCFEGTSISWALDGHIQLTSGFMPRGQMTIPTAFSSMATSEFYQNLCWMLFCGVFFINEHNLLKLFFYLKRFYEDHPRCSSQGLVCIAGCWLNQPPLYSTWPGARFTNGFLPAIQIRWKLRLAVIPLMAIRSQQIFAHATTAQLSCHVQNFVAITVLESRWEWNEISIEFELRWKNR